MTIMSEMVFGNNHDPSFQRAMRRAYAAGYAAAAVPLRDTLSKLAAAEQRAVELDAALNRTINHANENARERDAAYRNLTDCSEAGIMVTGLKLQYRARALALVRQCHAFRVEVNNQLTSLKIHECRDVVEPLMQHILDTQQRATAAEAALAAARAEAHATREETELAALLRRLKALEAGNWHWLLRSLWGGGIEQYGGHYVCTIYPQDATGPYDRTCDGVGDTPEIAIAGALERYDAIAEMEPVLHP